MAQIFISYARKDGTDESLRLYNDLQRDGIGAWRDNRIDPTADFTAEIEDAIDKATHVAVVVTPDLKRADSFVRLEIGYALTQKKRSSRWCSPAATARLSSSTIPISTSQIGTRVMRN